VTAPQYVHPQFRYRSPKQCFRRRLWLALACLGLVGIGAAMMAPPSASKSDAAIASRAPVSRAETIPTASPLGSAAVDPQPASEHGAQDIGQKPFCRGPSPSDGSCVSFQLPKVRMVRVATPRASSAGHQGNSAKPGDAAATSMATVGTMEPKKAQRSAHRQNQRRNQPSHSTPSRSDVRVADWAARGYARGDYGRQGFSRNFW
jgi:hypothetical protein